MIDQVNCPRCMTPWNRDDGFFINCICGMEWCFINDGMILKIAITLGRYRVSWTNRKLNLECILSISPGPFTWKDCKQMRIELLPFDITESQIDLYVAFS